MPIGASAAASVASSIIGSNAAKSAADVQSQTALQVAQMQQQEQAQALSLQQQYGSEAAGLYSGIQPQINDIYGNASNALGTAGTNAYNTLASGLPSYSPYLSAGSQFASIGAGAQQSLAQMYGIATPDNPNPSASAGWQSFLNTPAYQWAAQQGNLGLDRTAASKGLLLSGGQLKDAMSFNQGLASQQFTNVTNALSGIAGQTFAGLPAANAYTNTLGALGNIQTGTAAAQAGLAQGQASSLLGATQGQANALSGIGTGGANTLMTGAQLIGNTQQAGGQSTASGIVGSANAITGGINSGVNNLLLSYGLSKMPNYGTGTGTNTATPANYNPSSYAAAPSTSSYTNFNQTGGLY